ncbi:hypothetical protein J3Q64DRAFT_1709287 [Phycomyces blakesleeanus]|uniref:JmjC domain-containing protein n=1 Tax=Phycomyces blakesleeanus TaxID=4837 RepID=A0ABR3BFV7_PHYBL
MVTEMAKSSLPKKQRSDDSYKNYKETKGTRTDRKIHRVKIKARSELDLFGWRKWNFCERDYWINAFVDVVPRIDYRQVSKAEFVQNYEAKNIPVVITHATDHWRAHTTWTESALLENYGSHLFKVGEDDDENNVYLKMKHFLHYNKHEGRKDDSPLYIFDSGFYKDRRKKSKSKSNRQSSDDDEDDAQHEGKRRRKADPLSPMLLLGDYQVPSYFSDDLFRLARERRRPPYRWLVMGGARSGTGIHIDPLGTSAWNALLKGHKRWCLFPPGTPKKIIDPPMKPYDHEGVSWFSTVFPKFKVRDGPEDDNRTLGERLGMVEVLQRPGETIFVPGGWPHVVMNLDTTIAVTQNFCSPTNLDYVYLCTRHSRPKLGQRLYQKIKQLGKTDPEFAKMSVQLDMVLSVPRLPPSSSDSSSSSSSSTTLSSSGASDNNSSPSARIDVSSTDSETDWSDGTCMCHKCKRQRKRANREKALKKPL